MCNDSIITEILNIIWGQNYTSAYHNVDSLVKSYNINLNVLIIKLGDKALALNIDPTKKIRLISELAEAEIKVNKMCNSKLILMNIVGAFLECNL